MPNRCGEQWSTEHHCELCGCAFDVWSAASVWYHNSNLADLLLLAARESQRPHIKTTPRATHTRHHTAPHPPATLYSPLPTSEQLRTMVSSSPSSTWVDNLQMQPISTNPSNNSNNNNDAFEFNIASFNVLAESYISPRSHPNLPAPHAAVVFDKTKRRALLIDTLRRFCSPSSSSSSATNKWDIIALQELDLLSNDEGVLPALKSWGYDIVHTPTIDRRDCCAVVFDKAKFRVVKWEVVKFDDLATLAGVKNTTGSDEKKTEKNANNNNQHVPNNTNGCTKSNNNNNNDNGNVKSELTGMVRSFLRRNYAILAHLETITDNSPKQSMIVASVHLYWNPGYEYEEIYTEDDEYDDNDKIEEEEKEEGVYPFLNRNDYDVTFENEWRSHHYGRKLKKYDESIKSNSSTAIGGYRMVGLGQEYSQYCQFIPFDMTNSSRST
eukprot:scaffold248397_cov82-Cyclotella_meneghiniana.AAC.1